MRIVEQIVTSYSVWAKRQLDQALRAPVTPSQGQLWLAANWHV
ncbi:MAG: hypothetical protein QOC73_1973 [Actinomycetota bacterium]|jgi:hypothetical protein|nr:hypothetical protein [Actinomycetota bacterium]MDQ1495466.1 hypothetical protein [Actinomycetota bacterium]MDQ1539461.1 hypothetical protein [Actinomycetota bacterium]